MGNEQQSLATYVRDVLALERDIRKSFDTQHTDKDVMEYSDAADVVTRLVALSDMHIDALVAQLERLGGSEASPIKSAVTQVEGALTGAFDKIRKSNASNVSKSMRDDYTALALCTIVYSELITTADAMNDRDIAEVAKRHLADYANAIMKIGEYVPGIVIRELQTNGLTIDSATVDRSRQAISECWQQTSRPFHETTTTTGTLESRPESAPDITAP